MPSRPCLIEEADRPGRLRQEHVGRRLVALLGDQQRQIGRVAVAHLDGDAGLLGEAIQDRLDQVLRPAGVDRDRLRRDLIAAADPQPLMAVAQDHGRNGERMESSAHADSNVGPTAGCSVGLIAIS